MNIIKRWSSLAFIRWVFRLGYFPPWGSSFKANSGIIAFSVKVYSEAIELTSIWEEDVHGSGVRTWTRPRVTTWRPGQSGVNTLLWLHQSGSFRVGVWSLLSTRRRRLGLGFNFSSALPRCWGFSLGLTRESLHHHFRLMVRRIWPWAQPPQPSQPIIFALPPAPVSIASLASGARFDMLMPSGAPDSAQIILMLFFLTAALAPWIFT